MHHGIRLGRAAIAVAALVVAGPAAAGTSGTHAHAPRVVPVRCDGAVRHPIEVRIESLDPVVAGATVRLRLTASAPSVALSRLHARVERAGGAAVGGASRRALGRIERGAERSVEFAVAVPPQGGRRLIEFVVEGEGPNGPLRRGATFNLLPGGGEQPARIVTNAAGERVAEYRARRVAP